MTTQFENVLAKFGREMDASAKRQEARFEKLVSIQEARFDKLLSRLSGLSAGSPRAAAAPQAATGRGRRKVAAAPIPRKAKAAVAKPAGKRARKVAAAAAPTKAPRAARKTSGSSAGTVVERMKAAMGDAIMGAADVVAAMTKAGTAPDSKNLQNYLSFMLSQNPDHFENISRGKYQVKGAQGKAERVASAKTGSTESGGPVSTDEELQDLGISPEGAAENPFEDD